MTSPYRSGIYRLAAWVPWLQLATLVVYVVIVAVLGPRVTTVEAFFEYQTAHGALVLLRLDLPMLVLVSLYLGLVPALVLSLGPRRPLWVGASVVATVIAVVLSLATEASFALFDLGRQWAIATTPAQQQGLVHAGYAVLASGWWSSSASFLAGLLLQGSWIVLSVVMFRAPGFRRSTALLGLVANAVDLFQHLVRPFAPEISAAVAPVLVVYLVWYGFLAIDLGRLARPLKEN